MIKTLLLTLTALCLSAQVNGRTTDGSNNFAVKPPRSAPSIAWEIRPGFRDFGAISVSHGVVVTGNVTDAGGAFGFDASTGKRLWLLPGQMLGRPAVDDKAAYVVNQLRTGTNRLSSVELKTGRKLWATDGDYLGSLRGAPLVSENRLFMINDNGRFAGYTNRQNVVGTCDQ